MKRILFLLPALVFALFSKAQTGTICDPNGNVILFSNYDGGSLNIEIDQDIPNIKIGIVGYEATAVNISGTFVANVTEVIYAGFPSTNNNHCSGSIPATSVSGVSASIVSILSFPAATHSNPNGYNSIICNYSCNTSTNQGGCNTADQISGYFLTQFGGTLFSHATQYGCWQNAVTYRISEGGNCCAQPAIAPTAGFSYSATTICEGDCIDFTDLSTGTPTTWSWSFPGATTTSSSDQHPTGICYPSAGNYTVSLTAGNGIGTDSETINIVVEVLPGTTSITESGGVLSVTGGPDFQWNLNGTPIPGANASSYTPTSNGTYSVTVTGTNGCSVTTADFVFSNLNVEEIKNHAQILVFPNPATELVQVKLTESLEVQHAMLVDLNGKNIMRFPVIKQDFSMDVSQLPNGTYLLLIGGNGSTYAAKIAVRH